MHKILFMGPRFNKRNPEMVSGTIVLFEELINYMNKNEISCTIIDTNKKNYSNFLSAYLSIFLQIVTKQKKCYYISLNSSKDYMFLGPIIILIGKLFKKNTSLRLFGGNKKEIYLNSSIPVQKFLTLIYSNIDILFFETKYQMDFFSNMNKKSFWFPNSRNRTLYPTLPRTFEKKFVFMSHIMPEKGIDELIEAVQQLDSSYTVDFYGLIRHEKYTQEYFLEKNISYKGTLNSSEVLTSLNKYDVVILPSYKEGYPGIIIEAYSLGIPVITTTLPSIKEIVDPYKTGILVKPKSVVELVDAIQYIDKENYAIMSKYAYKKFDDFESGMRTKQFLRRIKNV